MAEAVPPDAQDVLRCIYCETEVATDYCRKCGDELCVACQNIHLKSKVSSGHDIVPIMQKYTTMSAYKLCLVHSTEKYDAACSDCQEPVCVYCITEKHSEHKIVKLVDLCGETKLRIAEELDKMNGCIIPKSKYLIENNRVHRARIHQIVANFLLTLQECVNVAHKNITEQLKSCEEKLSDNNQTLEEYLNKLNNCIQEYRSREHVYHPADLILFHKDLKQFTKIPTAIEVDPQYLENVILNEQQINSRIAELTPELSWLRTRYGSSSVTSNGLYVTDGISKSTGNSSMIVVAINIGTRYTYHGFSFVNKPMDITAMRLLNQCPTCVLFEKDLTFKAFGKEAENIYEELQEKEEHNNWIFVRLWETPFIQQDTYNLVKSVDGKDVPAMVVYTAILKYFTEKLRELFEHRIKCLHVKDVLYVFTISQMWNTKAKGVLIEASQKINIGKENYHFVTDVEAAYIFCSMLPQETISKKWIPYKLSSKVIFLNHKERKHTQVNHRGQKVRTGG